MINVLMPLNKSVPSIYKYYPQFMNDLAKTLYKDNINLTILVFSDLLIEHLDSYTLIDGKTTVKNKKSISELEYEYKFSFRNVLYTDLMQTSNFINRTSWRNIYLPEAEFKDSESYENKLNLIIEHFEHNDYSYVFTDQTTDFEHSFLRYLCNKKNIPFIRYLPNFMDRCYFVSYEIDKSIRLIEAPMSEVEDEVVNNFIDNYQNGDSQSIYKLFNDYSIYNSQKSILEKILSKSLKDYYQVFFEYSKRFYFNKIESQLKKTHYSSFDKNTKYIYYGLALTIESHLALQSFPFLNQINVIETISRSLPHGYYLYVKPHPWWSNTISLKDIKKISRIPFVKIIDPKHKIKEVLKHSKGIVTLNSTSGIEALALGKSVIALAETNSYADLHPDASYCSNLYDLPSMIVKMVNKDASKKNTLEYFKKMFSYSSEIPFEADRYQSLEDCRKKAKDFSGFIKKVISKLDG